MDLVEDEGQKFRNDISNLIYVALVLNFAPNGSTAEETGVFSMSPSIHTTVCESSAAEAAYSSLNVDVRLIANTVSTLTKDLGGLEIFDNPVLFDSALEKNVVFMSGEMSTPQADVFDLSGHNYMTCGNIPSMACGGEAIVVSAPSVVAESIADKYLRTLCRGRIDMTTPVTPSTASLSGAWYLSTSRENPFPASSSISESDFARPGLLGIGESDAIGVIPSPDQGDDEVSFTSRPLLLNSRIDEEAVVRAFLDASQQDDLSQEIQATESLFEHWPEDMSLDMDWLGLLESKVGEEDGCKSHLNGFDNAWSTTETLGTGLIALLSLKSGLSERASIRSPHVEIAA